MTTIKIGTRGSELAVWQASYTQSLLEKMGYTSEIQIIQTQGDAIHDIGFSKMEGKGFFTKELEEHLLRGDIDLAVHSMKDLPTQGPEGLLIAGVSEREDPSDTLLIKENSIDNMKDFGLPKGATVGTSSIRRKVQLLDYRPDLKIVELRGNVPTRIEKLRQSQMDAIVIAQAGINRIQPNLDGLILKKMHPREFVPAPAQGALAWQIHQSNIPLRKIIRKMHQPNTSLRTNIERGVLRAVQGGCQVPIGVYCEMDDQHNYHVWASFQSENDVHLKRCHVSSATKIGLIEKILEKIC
jgi:hydroxymethylbilane synthase